MYVGLLLLLGCGMWMVVFACCLGCLGLGIVGMWVFGCGCWRLVVVAVLLWLSTLFGLGFVVVFDGFCYVGVGY